jgi:hypothetical protein
LNSKKATPHVCAPQFAALFVPMARKVSTYRIAFYVFHALDNKKTIFVTSRKWFANLLNYLDFDAIKKPHAAAHGFTL